MKLKNFYKLFAAASFLMVTACASTSHTQDENQINSKDVSFNENYCLDSKKCLTKEQKVVKNFTFYSFLNGLPIDKDYIRLFIKSDTENIFGMLKIDDVIKAYYTADKKLFTIVVIREGQEVKIAQYTIEETSKGKPKVDAFFKIEDLASNNSKETKNINIENFYRELTKNNTIENNSGSINGNIREVLVKNKIPEEVIETLTHAFRDSFYMNSSLVNGKYNILYALNKDKTKSKYKYNVYSAYFVINGNEYNLYKFGTKYFDENGESLDKFVGRVPVEYKQISSPYSLNRRHPITGKIGHHEGIDYSANNGLPIKATGDGVIKFKGVQKGYGNLIIIQHLNNVETRYAHMSKFTQFSQGDYIKKGNVIGFVGTTGYATGPHVHFEIRKNDVPQDPATTRLIPRHKLSPKDKILLSKTINSYAMVQKDKKTLIARYP